MALSSLSGFVQSVFNWSAKVNMPASGMNLPPSGNTASRGKKISYQIGGNVANGANEVFFIFVAVAPLGTATLNLQNITDVLQFTGVSLVRLKSILAWLLSKADDSVNGTICTGVTVGNAGANPHPMFLSSPAYSFTLANGDFVEWGTGSAAGIAVNGGQNAIMITNNDPVNFATVVLAGFGATT